MIRLKPAVKRCYDLWYQKLIDDIQTVKGDGAVVELGSGSSYVKELYRDIVTSDVVPGVADLVIDGRSLPFPDSSVKALLLTHVFHHIPDVRAFLSEAQRVLIPGGVIALIDCAHTPLSRVFFSYIHPEPYDYKTEIWEFPEGNTMLDSNQALTWIVFDRDYSNFKKDFPTLNLETKEFMPWFSYLLSGGVNLRSLVPAGAAGLFERLDRLLTPLDRFGAIHWHLRVRKTGEGHL
jgi:SAM-dependent methyltransferase